MTALQRNGTPEMNNEVLPEKLQEIQNDFDALYVKIREATGPKNPQSPPTIAAARTEAQYGLARLTDVYDVVMDRLLELN